MNNEAVGIGGALFIFAGLSLDNPVMVIVGTIACLIALFGRKS